MQPSEFKKYFLSYFLYIKMVVSFWKASGFRGSKKFFLFYGTYKSMIVVAENREKCQKT